MMSMVIVSMIALTLATLTSAVNESHEAANSISQMTQHGRATIRRIRAAIDGAHASSQFPGFFVLTRSVAGVTIPDTLVVWTPPSSPNDPDGLPLVSEVTIFAPDPSNPQKLMELKQATNTSTVPAPSDSIAWNSLISSMLVGNSNVRLTKYLRTTVVGSSTVSRVRFNARLRPDQSQIAAFIVGNANWEDIYWPQNMFTADTGTRQNQCLVEIELSDDAQGHTFVGTGTIYYLEPKP